MVVKEVYGEQYRVSGWGGGTKLNLITQFNIKNTFVVFRTTFFTGNKGKCLCSVTKKVQDVKLFLSLGSEVISNNSRYHPPSINAIVSHFIVSQ